MSEAPARRSLISTSAPCRRAGPVIDGVVVVVDLDRGAHRAQLRQPLEAILEDRLVDRLVPAAPGSAAPPSAAGGPWRGPGTAPS